MKQKRVEVLLLSVAILFMILICSSIIIAADDIAVSNDPIEKGYSCLKSQLGDNCGGSKNTEQTAFNLLAMAYDSGIQADCKEALLNKKNENCWGAQDSSPCDLKSTAQAVLALKNIGENVDDSVDWLLSKKDLKTGLIWYLEIDILDTVNSTDCTINGNKITIDNNRKINGQDPAGLQKIPTGYWFEIKNIEKNYTISCGNSFVTTLLYKKSGQEVIYVSSVTNTASAGDSTTEVVNAYCFSLAGGCNYEGSLWAAIALAKNGDDVSQYIPYLSAMSDESSNKNLLPSSFLFMMTYGDEYYSQIVNQQVQGKYWDLKNRFYDSSLALFAIQSTETDAVDGAKNYFLTLQEGDGCWNDVYMNFLLYSGWPREPLSSEEDEGSDIVYCRDYGYYCTASTKCEATEDILGNYFCSGSDVCCKTQPQEPTCQEKGGKVCDEGQQCSRTTVIADDTNDCCPAEASCQIATTTNECEDSGGNCRITCTSNEEEKTSFQDSCEFGEKCCGTISTTGSGSSWKLWLVIILIILVILVILAIIFRNRLKILIFKTKTGYRYDKAPPPTGRPPYPQMFRTGPPRPGYQPRPAPTHMYGRAPERRTEKDKDFDDTMKKLRDMSK